MVDALVVAACLIAFLVVAIALASYLERKMYAPQELQGAADQFIASVISMAASMGILYVIAYVVGAIIEKARGL